MGNEVYEKYVKPWRIEKAGYLCRWCRAQLGEGQKAYCKDECREKWLAYWRDYQKRQSALRRAAKKEPDVRDAEGNLYKVIKKYVISHPNMVLLGEEELENAKHRLSKNFNATQLRAEGLVFLKVAKKVSTKEEYQPTIES
jgi:hypothetical protein